MLLERRKETTQVSWPLCLASLGLEGIGFTMRVWQALLDRSVTAQVPCPLRYRDRFAAFGSLGGIGFTMKVWQVLLDLSVTAQVLWPLCLASLDLGGIGFTLKVWEATRSGPHRSGIVTTLSRFARPGRDWIHPKSLASAPLRYCEPT